MQSHAGHWSQSLNQHCYISKLLPSHLLSSSSPGREKPSLESGEPAAGSSSALPLPKPEEEEAALLLTFMGCSLGSLVPAMS